MKSTTIDLSGLEPENRPRNPWLAFLLGIMPGVGQLYNGQWRKAILFCVIFLGIQLAAGFMGVLYTFYGYLGLLLFVQLFRLYGMIDAVVVARRRKVYEPRPFNRWYYHLIAFICLFGLLYYLGSSQLLGVQAFTIPGASGEPCLVPGDIVVANVNAYDNKEVQYGDLVVFHRNGKPSVYRAVGLPGDSVELVNNNVIINGRLNPEHFLKDSVCMYGAVKQYEQILPNGYVHRINRMVNKDDTLAAFMTPIVIPAGEYFLLGDNRDRALDSRYEGLVSRDSLMGRALYVFWGASTNRINTDLTKQ